MGFNAAKNYLVAAGAGEGSFETLVAGTAEMNFFQGFQRLEQIADLVDGHTKATGIMFGYQNRDVQLLGEFDKI